MQNNQANQNEKTIVINSIEFSYYDQGQGSIPLIFIHGFPFSKDSWVDQVNKLSTSMRTIAFDLRGFGKTSGGAENLTIDLFASDLIAFMDALKIEKCIACGISMGGYIIMNAVSRFPQRFKGLILSDTQCIADSEEGKEKRYKTIGEIEKAGLSDFSEAFSKNVVCEKTLNDKPEVREKIKAIIQQTPQKTVTGTLKALAERMETCTAMKKISIPILIICGKEDKVTPVTQSEFLLNNIQGAELKVIEGAGHMANLEQPEKFNSEIISFCRKIG